MEIMACRSTPPLVSRSGLQSLSLLEVCGGWSDVVKYEWWAMYGLWQVGVGACWEQAVWCLPTTGTWSMLHLFNTIGVESAWHPAAALVTPTPRTTPHNPLIRLAAGKINAPLVPHSQTTLFQSDQNVWKYWIFQIFRDILCCEAMKWKHGWNCFSSTTCIPLQTLSHQSWCVWSIIWLTLCTAEYECLDKKWYRSLNQLDCSLLGIWVMTAWEIHAYDSTRWTSDTCDPDR